MSHIEPRTVILAFSQPVVVRTAELADAAQLAALITAIWNEEPSYNITAPGETQLTVENQREWIQSHLEAPANLILVAEANGQVIASLSCEASTRRRLAHTADFGISVAEGWRDQGLGRLLIAALLDWASAHPQLDKIGLTVLASNARGIHLYTALGFVEEGRSYRALKYDDGSYVDTIEMYRWVK
jgi:RimJ/RimL family protein N-acetyltransferase